MSDINNNGGPAFPLTGYDSKRADLLIQRNDGMSLRDWFAGMALQGLLANQARSDLLNFKVAANDALQLADAMLKARDL